MERYWEDELHCRTGGVGGPVEEIDFSNLIGATINQVGFHPKTSEGNLTIDYTKNNVKKRVIFGFNDLGLWREWEGKCNEPSEEDKLLLKISEMIKDGTWYESECVKGDPMQRCYRFLSYKGNEIFKLTVKEIKLLPESMRKPFQCKYDNPEDFRDSINAVFAMECG